ncbi:MAG: DNA repair protein RecO [bacterium]|nr:DNA repair protein RecO [bacterium]
MFLQHRTKAIILKKENSGEADESFWAFTKDFGMIKIFAKAIKKFNSKLRSQIQVFYLSEIEFIEGKTRKTLVDAVAINKFPRLRQSLLRIRLVYSFSRVFCALIKKQESDQNLWRLIEAFFFAADEMEISAKRALSVYYFFFWGLLGILGYRLELDYCYLCRKAVVSEGGFWQYPFNGIICQTCAGQTKARQEQIPSQAISFLKAAFAGRWKQVDSLMIEDSVFKKLKPFTKIYFNFIRQHNHL